MDIIGYVNDGYLYTNGENEKWIPKSSGVYTKTAGDIIQGLRNSNGDVGAVMGALNRMYVFL